MSKKLMKINMLVSVCALLLLSGCTRSISQIDKQGQTAEPVFPAVSSAVRSEGSYPNVDALMNVKPGMTKAQLYELIGVPHFKEGVFRVKEWDYIFHFPVEGQEDITCQFKVLFDNQMKAQGIYFLPQNCLSKLKAPIQRELRSEALFPFASATLSYSGIAQVSALAAELKVIGLEGVRVLVLGHTDRIGKPVDNQKLSQDRADEVKRLLTIQGIPASIIDTRGLGDSEPRVDCPGRKSNAVIACLAPNRRMTVDVVIH
ncbi:OmpA family protein [Pragia fontium]|uniref:OmpA family protein n=1 Tax=Pragia fontium TaxID=82985 RepID=UPI000F716EBD|nr:OmpA family protein [Pragia fontium]VEJ52978.1 Outer membrane protein II* [Pragia fontium]